MTENEQQQIFQEWLSRYRGLLFKIIKAYAFHTEDHNDLFLYIHRDRFELIINTMK